MSKRISHWDAKVVPIAPPPTCTATLLFPSFAVPSPFDAPIRTSKSRRTTTPLLTSYASRTRPQYCSVKLLQAALLGSPTHAAETQGEPSAARLNGHVSCPTIAVKFRIV